MTSKNINNLIKHILITKQDIDTNIGMGGVQAQPQTASFSSVPSETEQKEQKRKQLSIQYPLQFRMYLVDKKYLPRREPQITPQELEPPIYPIESTDGGVFIDKRLLHQFHPEVYEDEHAKTEDDEISFGGIIMNEQGMILLRKPKPDRDGNPFNNQEWSFAKGGANEGEEGKDAALREVFEETGYKPKLGEEVAGHYQSGFGNNKYFIMHVDENTEKKDFGDETSELKWVTPDEAFKLLRQNTDVKDIDDASLFKTDNRKLTSSERDMNALAQATNQHESSSTEDIMEEAFSDMETFGEVVQTADVRKKLVSLVDFYSEHGEFPENWDTTPEYAEFAGRLVEAIQMHTNPTRDDSNNQRFGEEARNLFDMVLEGLDKKNGIGFKSDEMMMGTEESKQTQDISYWEDWINAQINSDISASSNNFVKKAFLPSFSAIHWAFTRGMSAIHLNMPFSSSKGGSPDGNFWKDGQPFAKQGKFNNGIAQVFMPNLMAEVMSEAHGRPNNFMYGFFLAEEINTRGDLVHRTDRQRKELIEAYENYLEWGKTPEHPEFEKASKGTFSWGESYDFAKGDKLTNKYIDSEGTVQEDDVDSWEFVYHRSNAHQRAKDKIHEGLDPRSRPHMNVADYDDAMRSEYADGRLEHMKYHDDFLNQLGASYSDTGDTELDSKRQQALIEYFNDKHTDGEAHFNSLDDNEKYVAYGKAMLRDYYQHMRNLNSHLWDLAYPDESFIGVWRKFNGAREIVGDNGLDGAAIQNYTQELRGLDTPKHPEAAKVIEKLLDWTGEMSETGEGLPVHPHSSPVTGGAMTPIRKNGAGWEQGRYAMLSKVSKNDLVLFGALFKGMNTHDIERETLYLNNPKGTSRLYLHSDIRSDEAKTDAAGSVPVGGSDREVQLIENKGGKRANYLSGTNGVYSENAFGDMEQGITKPKIDFADVLTPMTSKDNTLITSENRGKLGSNKGGGMKDRAGNHFYVKTEDENRNIAEVISNNIYRLAGINVPETDLINYAGGKATRSKWLPNTITEPSSSTTPEKFLNNPDIKKGIFIDMILANHDVTGTLHDNLVESDGKIYRLDQGGTLQYRAKNPAPKIGWDNWDGDYIYELGTMMDDEQQEKIYGDQTSEKHRKAIGNASNLYKQMTDADYKSAADTVLNLTNSQLDSIVDESALESPEQKRELKDTLKRRRDSVLKWIIDNKPDAVDQTSLKSLQSKYNILKTELFKAVKEEKDFLHIYIPPKEIEYNRARNHGKARHRKKVAELYKDGIEESAEGMRKNLFEKGDKK